MAERTVCFVNRQNKSFLNKRFWKVIKSGIKTNNIKKNIRKTWYHKICQAIENNQLKCDDYSFLFSMCRGDDGQHFN